MKPHLLYEKGIVPVWRPWIYAEHTHIVDVILRWQYYVDVAFAPHLPDCSSVWIPTQLGSRNRHVRKPILWNYVFFSLPLEGVDYSVLGEKLGGNFRFVMTAGAKNLPIRVPVEFIMRLKGEELTSSKKGKRRPNIRDYVEILRGPWGGAVGKIKRIERCTCTVAVPTDLGELDVQVLRTGVRWIPKEYYQEAAARGDQLYRLVAADALRRARSGDLPGEHLLPEMPTPDYAAMAETGGEDYVGCNTAWWNPNYGKSAWEAEGAEDADPPIRGREVCPSISDD